MCYITQLNNGMPRIFPPPPTLFYQLSSSPTGGRISLAIRSTDEKLCGQLQPATLILWDILLFCNRNCSETLFDSLIAFQRLLPSPLHNRFTPTLHTDHVEQDAQTDVDYLII